MIVTEPPYDLVALVADADAQNFFQELIERGQQRGCIRPIRWRSERDAMRDALVHRPEQTVAPFRLDPLPRFVLVWDHEGSGREAEAPRDVADDVVDRLARSGIPPEDVLALPIAPEFEGVLAPVWPRVVTLMAERRKRPAPSTAQVLQTARRLCRRELPETLEDALESAPKEVFTGLRACLDMRASPREVGRLGAQVSIPTLKTGAAAGALSRALARWFPLT